MSTPLCLQRRNRLIASFTQRAESTKHEQNRIGACHLKFQQDEELIEPEALLSSTYVEMKNASQQTVQTAEHSCREHCPQRKHLHVKPVRDLSTTRLHTILSHER
jgi:hypothetical protein